MTTGRHGWSDVLVRPARAQDLARLIEIERAAGEPFRAIGMAAVADDDLPTAEYLRGYQAAGRAWVATDATDATDAADTPVGYLLLDRFGAAGFVEQVSVHPAHRGRRIGAALLEVAQEWARTRGLTDLLLTTFADVRWNAPYYRRLGFRDVPPGSVPDWLRGIRAREAAHGLDAWPRVALSRPTQS